MSDRPMFSPAVLGGLIAAAGLVVTGFELKQAVVEAKRAERFVTVRGLSEREVKADTASWSIRFTAVADDLAGAYAKSESDKKQVLAFLASGGMEAGEIEAAQMDVSDTKVRDYGP